MTREEVLELIAEMQKPLNDRVNNMIRFGEVINIKSGKTQSIQICSANNEVIDNAKYIETYGITSKPRKGSELVSVNIQGNAGNVMVLNIGNRELRFKGLEDGEVAIYDDGGNLIYLKNGGKIEVTAPNTILTKTKDLEFEATQTIIKSSNINLGGEGGKPVATIGSEIQVTIDKGSSAGVYKGIITSGSSIVKAVP